MDSGQKVGFISSPSLIRLGDLGTHPRGRSSRVHALIRATESLKNADIVASSPASREDLLKVHSKIYVEHVFGDQNPGGSTDEEEEPGKAKRKRARFESVERFGLVDDCPSFPEIADYCLEVAGSTLTATELLKAGDYRAVINLEGGRHHAKRGKASGFCYVQDVALGILNLTKPDSQLKRRPRVLYLDLDVHFGDGVSAAFQNPYKYDEPPSIRQLIQPKPSVLCISIHHHAPGFFPADDKASLTPPDTKNPFAISIPLSRGVSNDSYATIWPSIEELRHAFDPDYVVVLLGMDALAGDDLTLGIGNWGTQGVGGVEWINEQISSWGKKTLLLAGGGYNVENSARGWATAVSVWTGSKLAEEIPDHEYWDSYGPSFDFEVLPNPTNKDENSTEHLLEVKMVMSRLATRIERIVNA